MYFYCYVYILLLLCKLCSVHSVSIMPAGHSLAALTEVFPCFFLSCKANARVYLAKMEHGPHSSQINCVVLCIVCV